MSALRSTACPLVPVEVSVRSTLAATGLMALLGFAVVYLITRRWL